MIANVVSIVAVLVSAGTLYMTTRMINSATEKSEQRGRMPVVAVYPDTGGRFWRLENIGSGVALNIVVAQGERDGGGAIALQAEAVDGEGFAEGERWYDPIHLRPMRAGAQQAVPWPYTSTGVGISFTDALGRPYSFRTSSEGSRLMERQGIPTWEPREWAQINEVEAGKVKLESSPWAERVTRSGNSRRDAASRLP